MDSMIPRVSARANYGCYDSTECLQECATCSQEHVFDTRTDLVDNMFSQLTLK